MKLPVLCLLLAAVAGLGFAQDRRGPNTDIHYHLGPDSLPQDGVPKGEIRGPFTLLESKAFPGTQHTIGFTCPRNTTARHRRA